MSKNQFELTLTPLDTNPVLGTVNENTITYSNIYPNIDLRYIVEESSVKEFLILNTRTKGSFSFQIELKGLKVEQVSGKTVFVDKDGQIQWFFDDPFMVDATGKRSDQISLTYREENNKWFVDIVIDPQYLQDSNTVLPITIDPTINNWNVMQDNFIASNFPTSIFRSNNYMNTGYNNYFGITRSLIRFFLPSLPSDAVIQKATINAYQTVQDGKTASVDLYRITSNWEPTVTWDSQPSTAMTKDSTVTSNIANQYWSWDITKLMKDWYNGVQPNFGILLKQQNETTSANKSFNTVNSGMNTPRLTIDYIVDPIGAEDYWTLTMDNVNPANGNFVFQQTDVSISGIGPDVTLTRTYNSRKSLTPFSMFGYGWMLNYQMRLVDAGTGPITFIDGDSTRHIFGENPNGGYETPDGLYLELVKNTDGTYKLTATDGTVYNFNNNGLLLTISDTNSNNLSITYSTNDKIIEISDTSGRITTFSYGSNGYVESIKDPANRTISFSYDSSGNLVSETDADGHKTSYQYDTNHKMINLTNSNGQTQVIDYDASNRVIAFHRPMTINGVQTTSTTKYIYDTNNTITMVIDGENRRTDYSYNLNGNVIQITENPLDPKNRSVTTYEYDNQNNLISVVEPNANEADLSKAYFFTYDEYGNITSIQKPTGDKATMTYNNMSSLTSETDFNNNRSEYQYDENQNQTESIDPMKQSAADRYNDVGNLDYSTTPLSAAVNLVLNSSFEIPNVSNVWPEHWSRETARGATVSFNWSSTAKFGKKAISISNTTGWAIVASKPVPFESGATYVASGFIKTENVKTKAIIKAEYLNASGNSIGQTYAYGLRGTHDWTRVHVVTGTPPIGTASIRVAVGLNDADTGTAYFDGIQLEMGYVLSAYNFVNNPSFEHDTNNDGVPDYWTPYNLSSADGIDTSLSFTGHQSFKITGEPGKEKQIKQNIQISGDQTTKMTLSGWSMQQGANANGGFYALQVKINYQNPKLNPYTNANSFSSVKDGWQHIVAEINPLGEFDSIDVYYYFYNQTGTAWFDAMRLEIGPTITGYKYDGNPNNPKTQNYVTEITDPNGNTVSYTYDQVGNQTSITDGRGNKTLYTYNGNNQVTKVIDPKQNVTIYGYDGEGNRIKQTDAKGNVTSYEYTSFNKLAAITNPLNQRTLYEHDKSKNLTKVTYPSGNRVSYTYDALNRPVSISYNGTIKWSFSYDANGNITLATDEQGNATTYSYDTNNRLVKKTDPNSNVINYTYDKNGNTVATSYSVGSTLVTNNYGFNPLDQLVTIIRNSNDLVSFTYDERGNISSVKNTNGTYTAYEYNGGNQLVSVKTYDANGNLINSFIYSYDANGNQVNIVTSEGTIQYQYDALNQLIQETLIDGTVIDYEYDAAGNRISKTITQGGATSQILYNYDKADQLISVGGTPYRYDANGNLIDNGTYTFVYNADNRLTEVRSKSSNNLIASYRYDEEGRLTRKTTPSWAANYYYDQNNNVIFVTDAAGTISTEYTWDSQGHPLTMIQNGNTYYYHLNGHGDVVAITDKNGTVVASYRYDAWGNIISKSGPIADINPYRYAGYRWDETIGMYYLLNRMYDPTIGRFTQSDWPHGLNHIDDSFREMIVTKYEKEPLEQNRYLYAKNNCVMYIDQNGNIAWWISSAAIGGSLNAFPYLLSVLKRNNYKSLKGLSLSRLGTAFVVGAITSVIGKGYYGILSKYGANIVSKMVQMASYEMKVYSLKTIAKGQRPTLKGLAFAAITGTFSSGLNAFKRLKFLSKYGSSAMIRYARAFK